MKQHVGLFVFCAVFCVAASEGGPSVSGGTAYPPVHLMLKMIAVKLDGMESRLQKVESMQLQLQKNIEGKMQEHQSNNEQSLKEVFTAIQKLERQVALNFSEVNNRDQELHKTIEKLNKNVDNVHNISQQIVNVLPQVHQIIANVTSTVDCKSVVTSTAPKPKQPPFSSCKDVPSKVSGTYMIRVKNDSEPFEVYCEQEAYGGGWIVFQYRYDGSLDFYRGWNEFRDGFGNLSIEFWLGLEKIHLITSGCKHELIVELKDFSENYKYARYDAFEIGSESDQYDIKAIGNYSGTAGDMLSFGKGVKFSTKDRGYIQCAQEREGASWQKYCTDAHLNGRYSNAKDIKSLGWFTFHKNWHGGMSFSRMMIRELE